MQSSQIDADEPMTEAIANGNARYELPADDDDDLDMEINAEMQEFVRELCDGQRTLGSLEPSELPTERILEDTQKDSVEDSDKAFETPNPKIPGCADHPIDLTQTDQSINILGLELQRTETEFKLLQELDHWAAAKAAHLWVRAEEDEHVRNASSYRLIQALAYELKQVVQKLEF